jgi:hypothetical protein
LEEVFACGIDGKNFHSTRRRRLRLWMALEEVELWLEEIDEFPWATSCLWMWLS